MRKLSSDYISGASKNVRDVGVKIEIGKKTYLAEDIISFDIQSTLSSGGFGIGSTPSDRLSLKIYDVGKIPKNTSIKVYTSFNSSGYEPLGLFYCEECTQNGKITSIIAYDKMYSQSKKLCKFTGIKSQELSPLSFPCSIQDMLNYICAFRKITCEFECQPFVIQSKPKKSETEYYTVREILGFIASAHGCNAKFNLDGELIFKDFSEVSSGITISDILDQDIDNAEPFTVNGVAFSVDNETQIFIDDTEGSEYDEEADGIISVDNPLASIEIAEYVWQKLGNLSYYGGEISIRGTGAIECGDLISVENFKNPDSTDSYVMCVTDIAYSINGNSGFVETLTSKRNVSDTKASGSKQSDKSSSILSAVSLEKNRLLYNGETYHVQYGVNKRIMCVTKGDKYAIMNSPDPLDSRIEAATAVMKGLTEDWDIELDCYAWEMSGYTLILQRLLSGYSGGVRCDWGDGTVDENTSHIYNNVGVITVKIKLLDTVSGTIGVKLSATEWGSSYNKAYNEQYIGARAYIGGSIESVQISHGQGVTHICFGENIKSFSGSGMHQQKIPLEMGIPPFIESIPYEGYVYNAIDYIYIPESCVSIGNYAFREHGASEIEIEEKGGTLTIGGYAFEKATSAYGGFNRVDVLRIPTRVVGAENATRFFEYISAGAIVFGNGRTEIPDSFCENAGASATLSELCNRPCFIFIPKTIKSIGNYLLSDDNRAVYIVCEGSWSSITKASNWDGANGSRENVTIIENDELYRSADKIIKTFVRRC